MSVQCAGEGLEPAPVGGPDSIETPTCGVSGTWDRLMDMLDRSTVSETARVVIRSMICPIGRYVTPCPALRFGRPKLVRGLRQAVTLDWAPPTPTDAEQTLEQAERWESLATLALRAALEVADEALLAGDLDAGSYALMNLVGGTFFGGGDAGHAIWLAFDFDQQVWRALVEACRPRWRASLPSPCPGPRLPQDIIETIGAFCGSQSLSRWPIPPTPTTSLGPATFMKRCEASIVVERAATLRLTDVSPAQRHSRDHPCPTMAPSPARRRSTGDSLGRATSFSPSPTLFRCGAPASSLVGSPGLKAAGAAPSLPLPQHPPDTALPPVAHQCPLRPVDDPAIFVDQKYHDQLKGA